MLLFDGVLTMRALLLYTLLFLSLLQGREIWVVSGKDFPATTLTPQEVRAIFLDKKRFIGAVKILPINYPFSHATRACFEKQILHTSRRVLRRYWLKAHYKGHRPPKVVQTPATMLSYLQKVPGSIGYIDANERLLSDYRLLLRVPCH